MAFTWPWPPTNSTPSAGWRGACRPRCIACKGPSDRRRLSKTSPSRPKALPDFLVRLQNVLKAHEVTASFFAHAGHGQLHVRPFLNLANPDDVRKMQSLADELYDEVFKVGGTISGEHGSGLSRTWFLRKQFGPLYDVFREVKRIFDPTELVESGQSCR